MYGVTGPADNHDGLTAGRVQKQQGLAARHHQPARHPTVLSFALELAGLRAMVDKYRKLGKIPDGGGWRTNGRAGRSRRLRGGGYDFRARGVDDHSRLGYAEILPDEKGSTCAEFWVRAAAWCASHGITVRQVMSDNALNYINSTDFANALASTGSQHVTIRPHCPWQNGKVERFNRTLAIEWAYRSPSPTTTPALPP